MSYLYTNRKPRIDRVKEILKEGITLVPFLLVMLVATVLFLIKTILEIICIGLEWIIQKMDRIISYFS